MYADIALASKDLNTYFINDQASSIGFSSGE
jgi:hypothetical protein